MGSGLNPRGRRDFPANSPCACPAEGFPTVPLSIVKRFVLAQNPVTLGQHTPASSCWDIDEFQGFRGSDTDIHWLNTVTHARNSRNRSAVFRTFEWTFMNPVTKTPNAMCAKWSCVAWRIVPAPGLGRLPYKRWRFRFPRRYATNISTGSAFEIAVRATTFESFSKATKHLGG